VAKPCAEVFRICKRFWKGCVCGNGDRKLEPLNEEKRKQKFGLLFSKKVEGTAEENKTTYLSLSPQASLSCQGKQVRTVKTT